MKCTQCSINLSKANIDFLKRYYNGNIPPKNQLCMNCMTKNKPIYKIKTIGGEFLWFLQNFIVTILIALLVSFLLVLSNENLVDRGMYIFSSIAAAVIGLAIIPIWLFTAMIVFEKYNIKGEEYSIPAYYKTTVEKGKATTRYVDDDYEIEHFGRNLFLGVMLPIWGPIVWIVNLIVRKIKVSKYMSSRFVKEYRRFVLDCKKIDKRETKEAKLRTKKEKADINKKIKTERL